MTLRLIPADLTVCEGAASFLQSAFWGRFKGRFGWTPLAFRLGWDEAPAVSPLLVMSRRLAPGLSFAYVPWGPESLPELSAGEPAGALAALARALRPHLPRTTAFIRFDPPWYRSGDAPPPLGRPFRRAAADIQPPDTVIINLAQDEEAILAGMKPKWRYNIRLAEKKGVAVREAGAGELSVFYELFAETCRRDGIAMHSLEYYQTQFALAAEAGERARGLQMHAQGLQMHAQGPAPGLRLYIASYQGQDLAAIISLFRGEEATYLYGASSDRERQLMAPYALQWRALRDARAAGCIRYDLFGIPPADDPAHPMAGLYRFKTGFGGAIIHRSGSWDYAYNPPVTVLFNAAEGLRKSLRDLKKR